MHDIKMIRKNPQLFINALADRMTDPKTAIEEIIVLDATLRREKTLIEGMTHESKKLSQKVYQLRKAGLDDSRVKSQIEDLKAIMDDLDLKASESKLLDAMLAIPNIPSSKTPTGHSEEHNVEISRNEWKNPLYSVPHNLLPGIESATELSGPRFSTLRGEPARIYNALRSFLIRENEKAGFEYVVPPVMVREPAMVGTGQLPKFADDAYQTTTGMWLIPTSEVPLTNLMKDQNIDDIVRMTACTPCFRSEAGSAGRDTTGLIRNHQFDKVEIVSCTPPSKSDDEFQFMCNHVEGLLNALELPWRKIELCSGDMGFSATRTNDFEVWMPYCNKYREVSSVSLCGDFQARRIGIKSGKEFAHTLNGSALPLGRILAAIVEHNVRVDGTIDCPVVLQPFMD